MVNGQKWFVGHCVASPVLIVIQWQPYVGQKTVRLGVYAVITFWHLGGGYAPVAFDSTLLGSNHGRGVWNLKGSRESGSVSRQTESARSNVHRLSLLTVWQQRISELVFIRHAQFCARQAESCNHQASFRRSLTDSMLIVHHPRKFVSNTDTIQQAY